MYSPTFNKIYIGYTPDMTNRFLSHNELGTKGYTVKYRPWVILRTEEYLTKPDAMKREQQLKGGKGRDLIEDFKKCSDG
ncbi:GIY-YIG nuclease family protein [Mucilaginibacter terrae]|uniref:Endonuclease n=1 Tax=Mucilaginibacter terrae TaxID=1955052 RepID=A0ABU3GUR3_9SPHI|nr:GIY-YIG nuclease family protein [Mucilaginibacter terrae]MDT3403206.1 putative endonuclease [Mucilaginibacter terrae]